MVPTSATGFKTLICKVLLVGIVYLYIVSGRFNSCFNQMDFLENTSCERNP